MKFGSVPIAQALGAIVAHGVHVNDFVLKKGEIVAPSHIDQLADAGVRQLVVARLDHGDIGENEAARLIAEALGGPNLSIDRAFTGRANLFARMAGVLHVDVGAVDRLNAIDESVTLATLPPYRAVVAGEMVATVKIIPFAVPGGIVDAFLSSARATVLGLHPFRSIRVAVLSTVLPGLKAAVITKTVAHLADRLAIANARIVVDERVPHDTTILAEVLATTVDRCDLVVIFGASAITDRRDIIPAAISEAGGTIEHFGMPVDPGNLLLLGRLRGKTVIGAPGCARSPKENGFDWVLQRLLAGLEVTRDDIRKLGAGGLLMEIVSRPQPRNGDPDSGGGSDSALNTVAAE